MEANEGHMTESVAESTTSNLAEPVTVEKQVPQSVVNRIVGESKKEAYEQGVKAGQASISPKTPVQGVEAQRPAAFSNLSEEQIKTFVKEQLESQAQAERDLQMQQAAQEFFVKLKPGEEKYTDFTDAIQSVNWTKVPAVLDLANLTDNTSDVMYELAKNPQKAIHLNNLAQVNAQAAIAETKKLAESIKQNQRQHSPTRPPLSALSPSVTRTDNGTLSTVSEYRQQPWLLG